MKLQKQGWEETEPCRKMQLAKDIKDKKRITLALANYFFLQKSRNN